MTSPNDSGNTGLCAAQAIDLAALVAYGDGAIVSRTLAENEAGTLTLFAFDAGQGLSEHSAPFDAIVQIRYNHAGAPGRVRVTGPGAFDVKFASPVAAVTPGQAAVVYDGDRLLGGGWIE